MKFESGIEVLTLMRDRITKQECPICGAVININQCNEIVDEYIKDNIKICKTHLIGLEQL